MSYDASQRYIAGKVEVDSEEQDWIFRPQRGKATPTAITLICILIGLLADEVIAG